MAFGKNTTVIVNGVVTRESDQQIELQTQQNQIQEQQNQLQQLEKAFGSQFPNLLSQQQQLANPISPSDIIVPTGTGIFNVTLNRNGLDGRGLAMAVQTVRKSDDAVLAQWLVQYVFAEYPARWDARVARSMTEGAMYAMTNYLKDDERYSSYLKAFGIAVIPDMERSVDSTIHNYTLGTVVIVPNTNIFRRLFTSDEVSLSYITMNGTTFPHEYTAEPEFFIGQQAQPHQAHAEQQQQQSYQQQ